MSEKGRRGPPQTAEPRTAADYFREAARLVNRGLLLLDARDVPCPYGCAPTHVIKRNPVQWNAHFRLAGLPDKLLETATEIEHKVGGPQQGYDVASRWVHEHGPQGPSVLSEAVALLKEARAALDAPSVPDEFREEVDHYLAVVTGNGRPRPHTEENR